MQTIKRILIAVVIATALSSCAGAGKLRFSEPASVEIVTPSKFTVNCTVENRSAHKMILSGARVELRSGNGNVATVILPEAVTIPGRSSGPLSITFRIKFSDPLTMLTMTNLESLAAPGFTLRGEAVVKSGIGRKKIRFDDYPLSEILTNFDPDGKINFNRQI